MPPRPTTPPPLPETVDAATAAGEEGTLDQARAFSWIWVWAAAAAVVVVAVALAGVATSWFGLAGPSDSTVAAPTSTASSVVVDTSGVPSTEPPTTAATTIVTTETVLPATTCVVGALAEGPHLRLGPGMSFESRGRLAYDETDISTTGRAARDDNGDQWREVSFDGRGFWVHSYYLSPGTCSTGLQQSYCVNRPPCELVEVRRGPEEEPHPEIARWLARGGYPVSGSLTSDDLVEGTGVSALDYEGRTWIQIWFGDGIGWVHQDDLITQTCEPAVCTDD